MVEEILWDLSVFPMNKINKEDVWGQYTSAN